MDYYNEIIKHPIEEVDLITKYRIEYLEKISDQEKTLGYNIGHEFTKQMLTDERTFELDVNCFHPGYIKKDTKVVFGLYYDTYGNASNYGKYYYMDTYDYIYEFTRFIYSKDVTDQYEFFGYVLDFLKMYFGFIEKQKREDMFKLLVNSDGNNIAPINEHGISWFKNMGNAMCTEYSIMAQNILSIFGFESYLIIGNQNITGSKPEGHAFNLVKTEDDKSLLMDFSNHVYIIDYYFRKIGYHPFIEFIEDINYDLIDEIINGDKHFIFDNHNYLVLGNSLLKITDYRKRDYYIDGNVYGEDVKCKKLSTY